MFHSCSLFLAVLSAPSRRIGWYWRHPPLKYGLYVALPNFCAACLRCFAPTTPLLFHRSSCDNCVFVEQEVYRFLGLCPADVGKLEPENVTESPDIPKHKRIDADSFQVRAVQRFGRLRSVRVLLGTSKYYYQEQTLFGCPFYANERDPM